MLDNATLLIAIAFSSGALMVTLLISWLTARRDGYLISWAAGMGLVVLALAILGLSNTGYDLYAHMASFSALILGFALIYAGTYQFRTTRMPLLSTVTLTTIGLLATNIPFLLGYSGIGTISLNLFCALFMFLSGYQYWAGRVEAVVSLVAGAALFALTGVSFLLCAVVLISEGTTVLTAPPSNWAEAFNSIMAIVGLTGLGTLSLTLNQSRATRRHRDEALTDSLTGLLNRRALFDRFEQSEVTASTAVLMFDIDHFKQINDRRGHAAGDAVIRHFGDILRRNMRDDDIAARIGGEEFCAVLAPLPIEEAKAIAERIRAQFEHTPAQRAFDTLAATVSVGVATTSPGESFSSVLHRADSALYRAKDSGRNQVTTAPLRLIA